MKKLWIWILVGVLAAALIAGAIALDLGGGRKASSRPYEHNINYFYSDEESTTRFVADAEVLTDKLIGKVDSFLSCDGTYALVRSGTALYGVDKSGVRNLYSAGVDLALLSLDGKKAVFTTATEVHILDLASGGMEDIKPDGIKGISSIVVSPDGNTVGYTVKTGSGQDSYVFENGASRLLRENACIAAAADSAAFWYFADPADGSLWYASGKREVKLASSFTGMLEFSRDLKEVLFDSGGETLVSRAGGRAKPIAEGESLFMAGVCCSSVQGGAAVVSEVKDTDTLLGRLYYSYRSSSEGARTVYDIYYVNARGGEKLIAKNAYKFYEGEGGRLGVLMADGKLYDMKTGDPKEASLVASGAADFCTAGDGTYYFISSAGVLSFYGGKSGVMPMQLAEGVVSCGMTPAKTCVFIMRSGENGALMTVRNDLVPELAVNNAAGFETMGGAVFCFTRDYKNDYGVRVFDVYTSADGSAWSLAVKGAEQTGNR
ncbi:MAG: hypothetical protein II590_08075 [Clostridia bacterium]|nr:hypothetical protein [Clostridia bacterium]